MVSLGEGANSKGRVATRLIDEVEIKSLEVNDTTCPGIRFSGPDESAVDNPVNDKPDVDTPDADSYHILIRDWL